MQLPIFSNKNWVLAILGSSVVVQCFCSTQASQDLNCQLQRQVRRNVFNPERIQLTRLRQGPVRWTTQATLEVLPCFFISLSVIFDLSSAG
jgi:hypothetical protein